MQAVILVAGKGTRMRPFTNTIPKPLVELAGTPLLTHIFNALPDTIDDVTLVLGYKGEMIQERYGDTFRGKTLRYVWQTEQKGTAHALLQARDHLQEGSFLLMYGDDIVDKESITRAIQHKSCLLAYEHEHPENFGVILQNEDGTLKHIIEKPEIPPSNLVSSAGIVLHTDIFDYYGDWAEGKEWCIPDALDRYAQNHPVHIEHLQTWHPVNSPAQLTEAEKQIG
jgi:NDP-sugar pyrophosphorylase family protein